MKKEVKVRIEDKEADFPEVTLESKETLVCHQELDAKTGDWFVWLEIKDKNGKVHQKTEKVKLQ